MTVEPNTTVGGLLVDVLGPAPADRPANAPVSTSDHWIQSPDGSQGDVGDVAGRAVWARGLVPRTDALTPADTNKALLDPAGEAFAQVDRVPPAGIEPATRGLGNPAGTPMGCD